MLTLSISCKLTVPNKSYIQPAHSLTNLGSLGSIRQLWFMYRTEYFRGPEICSKFGPKPFYQNGYICKVMAVPQYGGLDLIFNSIDRCKIGFMM